MSCSSRVNLVFTGGIELLSSHSEDEGSISESMSELEFSLQQQQEGQRGERIYIDKDKVSHVNLQIVQGLAGYVN